MVRWCLFSLEAKNLAHSPLWLLNSTLTDCWYGIEKAQWTYRGQGFTSATVTYIRVKQHVLLFDIKSVLDQALLLGSFS